MSFQKKVKALEKAQKLDKGGPTCQLAMQKVCQKSFQKKKGHKSWTKGDLRVIKL